MRILAFCVLFIVAINPTASAQQTQTTLPGAKQQLLVWLNEDQKKALGELFSGYAEGMLCGKEVDFSVAATFLKLRIGQDDVTAEQLAEIAHMAGGIQRAQMDQIAKKRLDRKAIEERCKTITNDAFGPSGKLIPGLLK